MRRVIQIGFFCLLTITGNSQHLLDRIVTLRLRHVSLAQALDSMARRADLEFSYNSRILPGDSLVNCSLFRVTVRVALDSLLGKDYIFLEQGKYLIILPRSAMSGGTAKPVEDHPPDERTYLVSGHVLDSSTGLGIPNASVYVKAQLQSALTDSLGFFRLRLKTRYPEPVLTVSKEWYPDVDTVVNSGYDQMLTLAVAPVNPNLLTPAYVTVEKTWLARLFLSYRLRMQSLNLSHWLTNRPTQVSLLPLVGTHGFMGGQVTNAVSVNIVGGYSGGLKGVELGGVFNIDKKDVGSVQLAGVVNLAGGNVRGVQGAGVLNRVIGSVRGVQLAGIGNGVKGNVYGVQCAGDVNVCRDTMRGVQVSGFINRAHVLKGVQLGIVNFADTSTGVSIGLVSIIRHGGVHRLTFSMAKVTGLTAEYIQGNRQLNSIFLVGYNPDPAQRNISFGYGFGRGFTFSARWGLYLELTAQQLYNPDWKQLGAIDRFRPLLTWRIAKKIALFAGPAFTLYVPPAKLLPGVEAVKVPGSPYITAFRSSGANAWIDAAAGVSFF